MHCLTQPCLQECEVDQARGIGGTGQGFDAPSAGRAGGKGFGAHNLSATGLRSAMINVRPLRPAGAEL